MNGIGSTLKTVWRIAAPYFRSEDKWAGIILLTAVIVIELATVGINVLLNSWNNRFYNALQERNWDSFVYEIIYFTVIVTIFIIIAVYQLYLNQWLQIRWRKWMTERYLASFVVILWTLSSAAPLHLFGRDIDIPGYMVWGALIYAALGTWLAHLIGWPLVGLDFRQQKYEADFRFNLVRVRENSEQIALLDGDAAERQRLLTRFGAVVENWLGIMSRTKKVTAFTASYAQASVIFPYILVAPAYFANKRAGRVVVLHLDLSLTGRVAGCGRPPERLRGRD